MIARRSARTKSGLPGSAATFMRNRQPSLLRALASRISGAVRARGTARMIAERRATASELTTVLGIEVKEMHPPS